ncbi:MAG: hypothetical protein ACQBVK_02000 [Candidatus Phytoplasma sp. TWB_XP]
MSEKIITTKKKLPKKQTNIPGKSTKPKQFVKKLTTKPKKQLKTKTFIKQPIARTATSQKVIISKSKSKKYQKTTRKTTKPQPPKINVKDQHQQEHWFKRILKSIRNTIVVILPIVLIILVLWFVIANFFPEIAAKIAPVAQAVWGKTKGFVHWINKHGTDFIKQKKTNFLELIL